MTTAVRLAGYAAVLTLVFGLAWAAGTRTDSVTRPPATATAPARSPAPGPGPDPHAADPAPAGSGTGTDTEGLASTAAGYSLVVPGTTFTPGRPGELTLTVIGPDRRPVRAFDVQDDRPLHLVVVRRDAAGYQHLHPELGADGAWRVPLVLPTAGVYRAFADFVPTGGPHLVLGTDLFAGGEFEPVPHPPSRVSQVDGYQVRLDGDLVPDSPSQIFATVSFGGVPVGDLQPYLGAFGHLVALRRSDLAYVHVHPDAAPPAPTDRSGPGIAFTAEVPSPGGYRLFLDFRHGGVVRTAEFAVDTRDGA